ncbi:fucose permease [Vulcaniibacterium tengchongense]|uniref:Fucose permease n=1 Tax=Vulcaniibacterium tengchongense TaxID=1273429 RepID=A0A3N4VFU7_9GAMM|nr:fucose permease [Vulcaniibacterium tengchongense]
MNDPELDLAHAIAESEPLAAAPRLGSRHRRATRAVFLVAGLAMGAWAPLVPYAKARAGIDEATLGLLLLSLGFGSLLAMPVTGGIAARAGCRRVILASGAALCLVLPWLAWLSSLPGLALALFGLGAAIGTFDVAINLQAVAVEKDRGRALMSGFHGYFSIGGIVGAGAVSALLWLGTTPLAATLAVAVALAALLLYAASGLLREGDRESHGGLLPALPRGAVAVIGALCFVVFLAEGAMLDWSALLLRDERGVPAALAGVGYAAFAAAMSLGRMTGDRVVQRLGPSRVFLGGALCAAIGFALAAGVDAAPVALFGFALVGLGASNLVPILFTAAGRQRAMPASAAVSAISTLGYAGLLVGPALIGFVAHRIGLLWAFALLAAGLAAVAANARTVRA